MPEFSWTDIRSALQGILALKAKVERTELGLEGETRRVSVLRFHSSGPEISKAAEEFRDRIPANLLSLLDALNQDPESALDAAFYLYEGQVVRLEADLKLENEEFACILELGTHCLTDTLTVSLNTRRNANLERMVLSVDTVSDEAHYEEKLNLGVTRNGVLEQSTVCCSWDFSTGEMNLELTTGKGSAAARLNLDREGEYLTITTQDAAPMMNLFLEKPLNAPAICTMVISPGDDVVPPEYRNLSEWSLEDLFTLLTGLGGLLGLKLP